MVDDFLAYVAWIEQHLAQQSGGTDGV